jgi:DNA gyrase subunit B
VAELTSKDIVELKFPNGPRLRPSMYLGEQGKQQTVGFREISDNSITEALKGHADKVKVIFHKDGSYEVQDNGRGLPTDTNSEGKNGFILTLATLHSGGNFANTSTGKNGPGLNGVGGSVVNALSSRFSITVYKNKKQYKLDFQRGYAGHFDDSVDFREDSPFKESNKIIESADKRKAAQKKEWPHGTVVRWFYDDTVGFPSGETVDIDDIVDRLKYTVYIVPGLTIEVLDETRENEDGTHYQWSFRGDGGIREMVQIISNDGALPGTEQNKGDEYAKNGVFFLKTIGKYKTRTNIIDDAGHSQSREVEREIPIELAFRYGAGYDDNLRSFVNTIQTHMGGVHEEAFLKVLVDVLGDKMGSMKGIGIGKNDEKPSEVDYLEGLSAVLSINVLEPQFVGQQKDKLSGPDVKKAMVNALNDTFTNFVNAPANRTFIEPIFKKVIEAMRTRKAALEAKDVKRANQKLSSSASMPAKLRDCDFTGTDESELLICEGDSAAGTITKARDAAYQAVLPIRGKILNAWKASDGDILKNVEVQGIVKCLGAGSGTHFDVDNIRYGRVLFAADSDVDGLHINTLLTALFYKLFRSMVEQGRVYQAVSPLFEVTVGTGSKKEIFYPGDDTEMTTLANQLKKEGKKWKSERNKGLGEMDKDVFHDTVLDPTNRRIRRITLNDAEKALTALELAMGADSSDDRKSWLGDNYQVALDSGLVDL